MSRRFEFRDGSSNKFWEIEQQGARQVVRYGRIGTEGQTKEKEFDSDEDAAASCEKLIREKTSKGYQEVGATSQPPSAEKGAKKAAASRPSRSKATETAPAAPPTPVITWTKDYDRNEIAIWLGEFESKKDLESYVYGKTKSFYSELGLPKDIWCHSNFSKQSADLLQLLKSHDSYRSYADAVTKKVEQLRLKSYNSIIFLDNTFADRDLSRLASRAVFVGCFPYGSKEKKGLINNAHFWIAKFPSPERLEQYMEETYGDEDSESPISEFARDQDVSFYDHDLVYAEFQEEADLNKLVGGWDFPAKAVKQLLQSAAKMPIKDANTGFVADEDEFASPRSAKGKDYELWYVGQFRRLHAMRAIYGWPVPCNGR